MNPKSLRCVASLLAVAAVRLAAAAPLPPHDLYVLGQVSKAVFMGSRSTAPNGIYRSSDRVDIVHIGPNHPKVDGLVVDPRDANVLFAAALNGVLRSPDHGTTWAIMTSWDMTEPKSIAIDPHQPDHLYIGLPDGIGVSADGGKTWQRMNKGIKRAYTQTIVVDRTTAGRVVAGTELGIYVSDDGAKNWKLARAADHTVTDIKQSPHDAKVFFAATQSNGVWRSTNGGRSWQTLPGTDLHKTFHNVTIDPHNPRRVAASGWGQGVMVSEDGGNSWTAANAGLPTLNVWRVVADPDFPNRLYAAPHEKPIHVSDDFGQTWRPVWFDSTKTWSMTFLPRP